MGLWCCAHCCYREFRAFEELLWRDFGIVAGVLSEWEAKITASLVPPPGGGKSFCWLTKVDVLRGHAAPGIESRGRGRRRGRRGLEAQRLAGGKSGRDVQTTRSDVRKSESPEAVHNCQ